MARSSAQQAAIAISMKKAGKTPKRKMQAGGELDPSIKRSVVKNLLSALGAGAGILAGTKLSNKDKDSEKAIARDNKRIERKSARREKKGFKPISTASFKKGGATKTKKK